METRCSLTFIYLLILWIKQLRLTYRAAGGEGAAIAAAAMLLEDALVMHNNMELVPCPCSTLGTVPCVPQQQGQSVGSSSREEVGYEGC